MSIRDQKDATSRLEDIRFYQGTDPVYFSILNRVIEELEERDRDLDHIFTPARGFRVRAEQPISGDVEIEAGTLLSDDETIVQVALDSLTMPAAAVGNIRIDLISIDVLTGVASRTAGVEITAGSGFGAATRPDLPPNSGRVPLAYVYVDETPTSFADNIAVNVAGAIEDIRPAPGVLRRSFTASPGDLIADGASASVGSSPLLARANHIHPANVDAVTPEITQAGAAGAAGTSPVYARRDHSHPVSTESVPAVLRSDAPAGDVGAATTLPRADHRHPLNVDGTVPEDIGAAAPGTADTYARRDHVHDLPSSLNVNQLTLAVPLGISILGAVGRWPGPATTGIAASPSVTDILFMTSGTFDIATDRVVFVMVKGVGIDNGSWRIVVDGTPANILGETIGNTIGGWIGGPQQGNLTAVIDAVIPISLTAGTGIEVKLQAQADPDNPVFASLVVENPGAAMFMVYQFTGG